VAPAKPAQQGALTSLREEASVCRRCHLWRNATQTVFGEGPSSADLMLVGEQPGDQEDVAGRPFVGPAGRLLRQALEDVGIDQARVYLTNAVKHFKWTPRGKRRIHEKPNVEEIAACHLWLEGEVATLRPNAIVALGATAARAVLGPGIQVTKHRGRMFESALAPFVTVTVHPSSILRASDDTARKVALKQFTDDLREIARKLPARK
jgi:uracil-DNA glycosylase